MYIDHPRLNSPDQSPVLWHYMNLADLLSLLEKRAIRFARLNTFDDDPSEGLPTKPMIDRTCNMPKNESPAVLEIRKQKIDKQMDILSWPREHLLASCWHARNEDSPAMWKIYTDHREGVAIRSTFGQFRDSITDETHDVYGGMVTYVDHELYEPEAYNELVTGTVKRRCFEHEHEFRGLIMETQQGGRDLFVSVDLNTLISDVYVSPTASASFPESVQGLCARYELDVSVKRSKLLEIPTYIAER